MMCLAITCPVCGEEGQCKSLVSGRIAYPHVDRIELWRKIEAKKCASVVDPMPDLFGGPDVRVQGEARGDTRYPAPLETEVP
jgi:hypothetical protein